VPRRSDRDGSACSPEVRSMTIYVSSERGHPSQAPGVSGALCGGPDAGGRLPGCLRWLDARWRRPRSARSRYDRSTAGSK
jgi:hypothetical protein